MAAEAQSAAASGGPDALAAFLRARGDSAARVAAAAALSACEHFEWCLSAEEAGELRAALDAAASHANPFQYGNQFSSHNSMEYTVFTFPAYHSCL